MDLNKCWDDLRDGLKTGDAELVADACDCLLYWIESGGTCPPGETPNRFCEMRLEDIVGYLTDLRTVAEWSAPNRQEELMRKMTMEPLREKMLKEIDIRNMKPTADLGGEGG